MTHNSMKSRIDVRNYYFRTTDTWIRKKWEGKPSMKRKHCPATLKTFVGVTVFFKDYLFALEPSEEYVFH
jgi:hypothetical protein